MKNIAKKVIPLIIAFCVVLTAITVNVYAAGSSVAFSKSKLTIGESLTVTAQFATSSSDPMYGVEGYITYDPKVVEFVSGQNCNKLTDGKVKMVLTSDGKNSLTQPVTFKAIAAGKSVIAVESIVYVDKNDMEKSLSGCSATVTVTDPSTQASSNANLRGLSVSNGTLTPAFDPNVTSYSVTIPYEVSELWVSTSREDEKSTVVVDGNREMKVGFNRRNVIVTAENGNTKTYTVNITRLDKEGNVDSETQEQPMNDVIEVIVDGNTMYVQEDFTGVEIPVGFSVVDYVLDAKTIPAVSDDTYILVYLKAPDESSAGFYVVEEGNQYTKLITLKVGEFVYSILPTKDIPDGYTEIFDAVIGGVSVPAYKSDNAQLSDFITVFAKGPGGINSFYNYDTVDGTMQRATTIVQPDSQDNVDDTAPQDVNVLEAFNELNVNGKIVTITILAIMVLLVVAIIVLIVKIATTRKDKVEDIEDDYPIEDEGLIGFEYVSINDATEPSVSEEDTQTEPEEDEE